MAFRSDSGGWAGGVEEAVQDLLGRVPDPPWKTAWLHFRLTVSFRILNETVRRK